MDEIDWIGILGELAEGKKVYYKMPPNKEGYHRHHIKPQHMDGKDEDGMIYLTQEEHALAHWELWEKFHQSGDLGAVKLVAKGACIDGVPDCAGENHWNWQGGISKEAGYERRYAAAYRDKMKTEDPEWPKKQAERALERYHKMKTEDPEFLRKEAERQQKLYHKMKADDPEEYEEYLKRKAKIARKNYHIRKDEDPEFLRKQAKRSLKSYQKRKDDPEFLRKKAERARKYYYKKKSARAGEAAKLPLT